MRSVTFYSYKGGVGRTLALANVAHYLAQLGQTVVAVDFDLEAPGLDYKLRPHRRQPCGLVDLVYEFIRSRRIPPASEWLSPVWSSDEGGSIHLLSSGLTTSSDYWRRFTSIDWRDFLVGNDGSSGAGGEGLPFFLELKEQIAATLHPDFLLIDARTGITELGGIASTVLADDLVCLFVRNDESIEGTREILQALRHASRLPSTESLRIFPVLARLPDTLSEEDEHAIVLDVSQRMGLEAIEAAEPLMLVHSYPALQVDERLLMSDESSVGIESRLYADYVRFFNRILPAATIEMSLQRGIEDAQKLAYQNPAEAHKQLIRIALRQPHARSYRALLQFYRLRNEESEKLLESARKLAELTNEYGDELIWSTLMEILDGIESDPTPEAIRFIERAWRARGATDLKVGMMLAGAWDKLNNPKLASSVLLTLAESIPSAGAELLVKIINRLVKLGSSKAALRLSSMVKREMRTASLQRAWVRAITDAKDREEAVEFLGRSDVGPTPFLSRPSLWFELLRLAGREDEALPAAEWFANGIAALLHSEGLDTRSEVALKQLYEVLAPTGRGESLLRVARNNLTKQSDHTRLARLEQRLKRSGKEPEEE